MTSVLSVAIAVSVALYLALSKRTAKSGNWQATATPLASIMGSGFLVSAPLLAGIVGNLAIVCMGSLLLLAYLVGAAIRFNIRYFEPIERKGPGVAQDLAFLSRLVLTGAYLISITYYLQLLAAFVLNAVGVESLTAARGITTALLLVIGGVGAWRGLDELESLDRYAVSLNLGTIAALLVALFIFNLDRALGGTWELPEISSNLQWHDLRVLLGLLIIVQGFETSRYLGDRHSSEQRIATMRVAQLIASVIYVLFIGLASLLFHSGLGADVTAIIGMTQPVAAVLPLLLAITAVVSQFSAAVADSAGAGGLLEEVTGRRLTLRYAYVFIFLVTAALTWESRVTEIIAYASRAFALYYVFQCAVALSVAWERRDLARRAARLILFAGLSVVCLAVFALGLPAE